MVLALYRSQSKAPASADKLIFKQESFDGGLNDTYANSLLAPNEASDLRNCHFDERGTVQKRKGFVPLNAQAIGEDAVHSLYVYSTKDGTNRLLAGAGTALYQWDGSAFVAIKTGLSGEPFEFETYKDLCWITNGTDYLMKYDGTTVTNITTAPKVKYIKLYKNRLFGYGNPAEPSVLYFSDLAAPDTWPALNFVEVYTNDGDKGTGLEIFLDELIAFKSRSINVVKVNGDPVYWSIQKLKTGVGAVAQRTIHAVENTLYFTGLDGVYQYDGIRVDLVSEKITTTFNALNLGKLQDACAIIHSGKYWLAVAEGSSLYNNKMLIYDYRRGAWSVYTGINTSAFVVYAPSNVYNLYTGDAASGVVHQQEVGYNDNGAVISMSYATPFYDMGAPERVKKFKTLFVFAKAQSVTSSVNVYYDVNFTGDAGPIPIDTEGAFSKWGEMTWGVDEWGGMDSVIIEIEKLSEHGSPKGRYLRIKFVNEELDQPCSIYGFSVLYTPKKPK